MNNTHNSVSFPAKTCAGRTATAQTSRRFLSPTKKDSFVQLPTLNSALSWLAARARILQRPGEPAPHRVRRCLANFLSRQIVAWGGVAVPIQRLYRGLQHALSRKSRLLERTVNW